MLSPPRGQFLPSQDILRVSSLIKIKISDKWFGILTELTQLQTSLFKSGKYSCFVKPFFYFVLVLFVFKVIF